VEERDLPGTERIVPAFPKPAFTYNYQVAAQISALRDYEQTKPGRDIPTKAADRLLVASWNVANLGLQERRDKDYQIIAEMISWFDLVAVQETNDDLTGLRGVQQHLPVRFAAVFSDKGGNNERMAYLYDTSKVTLLDKIGEVAIPPSANRYIKIPGSTQKFDGFDRNPYMAAFRARAFTFLPVNVHLFFGSDSAVSKNRRALEAYAVARWADLRRKSANAFTTNIIVLGDFNLPKAEWGDPIWDTLVNRGLYLVPHSTYVGGTNTNNDRAYDQVAFFPGDVQDRLVSTGVFDFDGALFASLWANRSQADFNAYMQYYISDHRILWTEFQL
jgi:endonuclease/exonuclease/phosphatase family metal-dependent hydrolase